MLFILGWLFLNQAVKVLLKVSNGKTTYIQLFAFKYGKREQFDVQSVDLKISFKVKILECKSSKLFPFQICSKKKMMISN